MLERIGVPSLGGVFPGRALQGSARGRVMSFPARIAIAIRGIQGCFVKDDLDSLPSPRHARLAGNDPVTQDAIVSPPFDQ